MSLVVTGFLAALVTAAIGHVVPLGKVTTIAVLLLTGAALHFALDALLYAVLTGGL